MRAKRAWWEEHRDKAPDLFRRVLAAIVAMLRASPTDAQQYTGDAGQIIWRLLMPKTKNHVYFRVDDAAQEVEIVTLWNAVGGTEPDFAP